MRFRLLLAALPLAACSPGRSDLAPEGVFASGPRDRLCVANQGEAQRAGFIVHGTGPANCLAEGALERRGEGWALVPRGEGADGCRFTISSTDKGLTLGPGRGDCSYYCGPGAAVGRKEFRGPASLTATDLAGDPLC